jgi:hypothetical protein
VHLAIVIAREDGRQVSWHGSRHAERIRCGYAQRIRRRHGNEKTRLAQDANAIAPRAFLDTDIGINA